MCWRPKSAVFLPVFLCVLFVTGAFAQSPIANIGFERGSFDGWDCYTGQVASMRAAGYPPRLGVSPGRHTLISGEEYESVDAYGGFPVVCPNGSNYTVRLGNDDVNGEYESMTYTFTVPANATDFGLIYHYAVVFENPSDHDDQQQPRFQAKVYDTQARQYIDCGSFDFVSSSSIPGFELSSQQGHSNQAGGGGVRASVFYKPWSAVFLNLSAYAGKTLQLEFSTADCTKGGHFGYAYVDVDESYSTQITGSVICNSASGDLTLRGPVGFHYYYWYKANDLNTIIGTSEALVVPANEGDRYALRIVPYLGFGCENTVYATITRSETPLVLNVPNSPIEACDFINLSSPEYLAGSTPNLTYTYYRDEALTQLIQNAIRLTASGRYYIKGTAVSGCSIAKFVDVVIHTTPSLSVHPPAPLCGAGLTVDITAPAITAGSDGSLTLSYWMDPGANTPLPNPSAIAASGIYYIRGTSPSGCFSIQQVIVVNEQPPVVVTTPQVGCHAVDLTLAAVTAGSTPGLRFTYYTDAAGTAVLADPRAVTVDGSYYIRGTTANGCSAISGIAVTLFNDPQITIADPAPVIYPATIDITGVPPATNGLTYTFYKDSKATVLLPNPEAVGVTGTYYLKITNAGGCFVIKPVKVMILPPEDPIVTSINTFTPNGDGVNDNFKLDITGYLRVKYFRIFTRWGEPVFETVDITLPWDGKANGKDAGTGTYYWVFDSVDEYRNRQVKRSGSITLIR